MEKSANFSRRFDQLIASWRPCCNASDFVLGNAERAAKAVIEQHERIQLDRVQPRQFVESL
ncbi:type II toxin -antitoxin system TacA 1-like antitoxin [Crateriforma conspicua]|uniref:type II toxin -antitoxin system TacA 1-like antitoxin n=1 Tax=Crateriforma conspicua TaxID=2527996 RepID=UPI00119DBB57|nr:DUF1778 domain-containing protein [Crateriforma conspicua]